MPIHSDSQRPERLRRSPILRQFFQENTLRVEDLVLPIFLNAGSESRAISSLPGVQQWSVESSLKFVETQVERGLRQFILFGIVDRSQKSPQGDAAWNPEGPVPQALRRYRQHFGEQVVLFADACFCEYTDHGHCGPLKEKAASVSRHRAQTLEGLGKMAVEYVRSGADIVAPSGMVDGMVAHIRHALDQAGFEESILCSYAVKYASQFYGPFREAAENTPTQGDRKSYQMNVANRREALREIDLDVGEGADMILVKPALPCLDIVSAASERTQLPVGAYHVSGEYAQVKAAAERGWIDEFGVFSESLLSMKRAGAQFILTYWADEAARWMAEGRL